MRSHAGSLGRRDWASPPAREGGLLRGSPVRAVQRTSLCGQSIVDSAIGPGAAA